MKNNLLLSIATLALTALLPLPCFAAPKSALVSNLEAGKSQTIVTYGTSLTAGGAWVKQLARRWRRNFQGARKSSIAGLAACGPAGA